MAVNNVNPLSLIQELRPSCCESPEIGLESNTYSKTDGLRKSSADPVAAFFSMAGSNLSAPVANPTLQLSPPTQRRLAHYPSPKEQELGGARGPGIPSS